MANSPVRFLIILDDSGRPFLFGDSCDADQDLLKRLAPEGYVIHSIHKDRSDALTQMQLLWGNSGIFAERIKE